MGNKNVRPFVHRVLLRGFAVAAAVILLTPVSYAEETLARPDFFKQMIGRWLLQSVPDAGTVFTPAETAGSVKVKEEAGKVIVQSAGTTQIGGKTLPVTVKAAPTLQNFGKVMVAFGRAAGPVGVGLTAFQVYSAIEDYSVTHRGSDVPLDITKTIKSIECANGCYEYRINNEWGSKAAVAQTWFDSYTPKPLQTAGYWCDGWATKGTYRYQLIMQPNNAMMQRAIDCTAAQGGTMGAWADWAPGIFTERAIPPYETASTRPATEQELADAIAAKSGWPTSMRETALKNAIDYGQKIEFDESTKTVTGPSTLGEPKVTTKTNPDGTTQTTTERQNVTYQGNTITVSTSTSVVNYNPVTNTSTTTIETVDNPDIAPEPTKTDCEKTPDMVGCMKPGDIPTAEQLPKTTHALDITPVSFAGGAACPPPVQFQAFARSYSISYDPLCDKLALIKPLILLLAGVAAAYILADSFKV